MPTPDLIAGLPGEAIIRRGLADCRAGDRTIAACLVAIAGPRLRRVGLWPAHSATLPCEPERELYRQLRLQGGDAYQAVEKVSQEFEHRGLRCV